MKAPQWLLMQSPVLKNHGYFCICKSRQQNFRTAIWKPPGKGTKGMCSVMPAGLLIQLRNCYQAITNDAQHFMALWFFNKKLYFPTYK